MKADGLAETNGFFCFRWVGRISTARGEVRGLRRAHLIRDVDARLRGHDGVFGKRKAAEIALRGLSFNRVLRAF